MVEADIQAILMTRLTEFDGVPADRIAWPGMNFTTPGDGDPWLEARPFPAQAERVSYTGPEANRRGYFQISACQRIGRGMMTVLRLADDLAAHFPEAARYRENGLTVVISRPPAILSAIEEDGQVRVPVAIYYQSIA